MKLLRFLPVQEILLRSVCISCRGSCVSASHRD